MIFDDFLKAGLIPIGGADDIYNKLIEASKQLEAILKKEKSKVINYTLVAIDSHITVNEPVLSEVEEVVTTEWKLIRSQFHEMPISIYRGVILQALENLGNSDPIFAGIIWYTANGVFPLLKQKKNESDIILNFLQSMGEITEKESVTEWSLNEEEPKVKISALKLDKLDFGSATIEGAELKAKLKIAAARTPQNYDPYNHQAQWSEHFAENAKNGIVEAFNKALNEFNNSLTPDSIEKPINNFFTQFKKSLDQSLKTTFTSLTAIDRRNKLIWWKEALYSKSTQKSYRDLDEFECAIAMTYDLFNQLPKYCPISVSYILKETYNSIPRKNSKIKVLDFFTKLSSKKYHPFLEAYIKEKATSGRTDFTGLMGSVYYTKPDVSDVIIEKFGVEPDMELEYETISILYLNSLIANYLVQ